MKIKELIAQNWIAWSVLGCFFLPWLEVENYKINPSVRIPDPEVTGLELLTTAQIIAIYAIYLLVLPAARLRLRRTLFRLLISALSGAFIYTAYMSSIYFVKQSADFVFSYGLYLTLAVAALVPLITRGPIEEPRL